MKSYLTKIKAIDEGSIVQMIEDLVEPQQEKEDEIDPIIGLLQTALQGEYQQWDLYTAYASRLKGEARSPIAEEFKAHADEETGHIETLQRYIVSMGDVPTLERKPVPDMHEAASIQHIVELMLEHEREAVALYKKILGMLPENEALMLDIENILVLEQEHVHDLELLARQPEIVGGLMFVHEEPGEPTRPQAGYGNCGCGNADCGCYVQKINNHWCQMALRELTPDIYARWQQGQKMTEKEKEFVSQALMLKGMDKRSIMRFMEQ